MVACLALFVAAQEQGPISRDLVGLYSECIHVRTLEAHEVVVKLVNLGQAELALELLGTDLPEGYKLYRTVPAATGLEGRALERFSTEVPKNPARRVIQLGGVQNLRDAIRFIRDCERIGADPGISLGEASAKAMGLAPDRTRLIDLGSQLNLYQRYDLCARLVLDEITRDEFIRNKNAFLRLVASNSKVAVDALFKFGFAAYEQTELLSMAASSDNDLLIDTIIDELERRSPSLATEEAPGFPASFTAASRLWQNGKEQAARRIVAHFRAQLVEGLRTLDEAAWSFGIRRLVALGARDIVAEIARWHETVGDRISKREPNPISLASAFKSYLLSARTSLLIESDDAIARVEDKMAALDPKASMVLDTYRIESLLEQGQFQRAWKSHRTINGFAIESEVAQIVEAAAAAGQIELAERFALEAADAWIARPSIHRWLLLARPLYTLGLKAELMDVLSVAFRDGVDESTSQGFRWYLAMGQEQQAEQLVGVRSRGAVDFLLSVLYRWDASVFGPKTRLASVAGRDLYQEAFDELRSDISLMTGNDSSIRARLYISILRETLEHPELTARVLAALRLHMDDLRPSLRPLTTINVIAETIPYDGDDALSLELQKSICEVLRATLNR